MNKKSLVSVNITTFNRSDNLMRCIDSVLKQDYQNIEIIIVDDCSTDNTYDVVKNYQRKDRRIKYFRHQKNKGNAHARNTAFEKCNGVYVAFLDDDDEWIENNKIKKQVEIFEKLNENKLGLVCSGILRLKRNGEKIIEKAHYPKDLKYEALKGGLIHNSTVLTKRKIIQEAGGFDTDLYRGIDSEFFRRVILIYNYNVFFMKDITTRYFEDSKNRLTDINNQIDYLFKIKSHYLIIKKFFKFFLIKPSLLLIRIVLMIQLYIKFLKAIILNEK